MHQIEVPPPSWRVCWPLFWGHRGFDLRPWEGEPSQDLQMAHFVFNVSEQVDSVSLVKAFSLAI